MVCSMLEVFLGSTRILVPEEVEASAVPVQAYRISLHRGREDDFLLFLVSLSRDWGLFFLAGLKGSLLTRGEAGAVTGADGWWDRRVTQTPWLSGML